MTPEERLENLQFIRESFWKLKKRKRMKVEKDYEDLLRLLNKHKVKYLIVGAFAVAFIQSQGTRKTLIYSLNHQQKMLIK